MQERRSEVRMMCADLVEVTWKDRHDKPKRAMALLEDISHSGACLQLEAPLPAGTKIRWESSRREFTGEVRYCVYRETGYFAGIELQPGYKWSKKAYKPQHLLDLRRLMAHAAGK